MSRRGHAWALTLLLSAGVSSGEEVRDFFNVIAPDAADPSVFRHADGRYYATMTTGRDITLWRSETLSGLGAGERKVIWTPPATGPNSRDIWAPEVVRLRGKWYVYYAADDGENANHRMYALENDANDPFDGTFVEKGKIFDPADDRWAIDGAVLAVEDRLYFVWSGWEGRVNGSQGLYIAPMSDPLNVSGPRVEISRPTFAWETRGAPPAINEGPQFLIRGRSIHLLYAASGSWTDHYCVGMLRADVGSDLLSPRSWKKHPEPVFRGANGVIGPGHCTFTTSPDGKEDWMLYHAARYPGGGWKRSVRAQPFHWDDSGAPRFGEPAPPDRPIALPGGEPSQERIEAEAMDLGGEARVVADPRASGGSLVALDRTSGTPASFRVDAKERGPCNVSIRYRVAETRRPPAEGSLAVNDREATPIRFVPTGPKDWSCVVLRVELEAGENRLRLGGGDRPLEVDCVSTFPANLKVRAPE